MKLARRVLASLVLILAVSPAYAADHFARVNEVLISIGGDTSKQFIEIEDTMNEAFSGGGYTLFVYGADGTSQAHSQTLALSQGTMRITLASAAAFTQFGLVTKTTPPHLVLNLGDTLPAAGTACFRKSGVDLHCMSWGAVTTSAQNPSNGRVAGPAPIDSMSVQRQAANCAGNGTPTPDAVNMTVTCMDPPTMMGGDAGMTGNDGGMTGDAGTTPMGSDDSCSTSSSGSWFGVVAIASMLGLLRRRRRA